MIIISELVQKIKGNTDSEYSHQTVQSLIAQFNGNDQISPYASTRVFNNIVNEDIDGSEIVLSQSISSNEEEEEKNNNEEKCEREYLIQDLNVETLCKDIQNQASLTIENRGLVHTHHIYDSFENEKDDTADNDHGIK